MVLTINKRRWLLVVMVTVLIIATLALRLHRLQQAETSPGLHPVSGAGGNNATLDVVAANHRHGAGGWPACG